MPLFLTLAGLGQVAAEPFEPGNVLISTENSVHEYTPNGTWVRTLPIPYPTGTRPVTESARDALVDANGNLQIYNGTFDPYLSRYDVAAQSWTHWTFTGWSTANNVSYGGIASHGHSIFVTDMSTYGQGDIPKGLVRFDLLTGGAQRFADTIDFIDVTLGLDGLLYGLAGDERSVYVYDPSTLTQVRALSLPFGSYIRGIAVSTAGEIYGASWNDTIHRFSATGVQLGVIPSGAYDLVDIDISPLYEQVVVGSRFGTIVFTNLALTYPWSINVGGSTAFATFVPPDNQGHDDNNLLVSSGNTLTE
ncbi:hypothetical protein [Cystobacter fuscus]|nr:hypothetical protein [Cystobacter fuscus]